MPISFKKFHLSFKVTVISIFIFASVITAFIAIGLQYYFSQSIAQQSALQLYDLTAESAKEHIEQEDQQTGKQAALLANFNKLIEGAELHPDAVQLFANTMLQEPFYLSIYIGFENGDLQQLVNINGIHNNRASLQAEPNDRWALISVSNKDGQRLRTYRYYDQSFNLRAQRQETTDYFANQRDWYVNADELTVYKSEAYTFAQSKSLGQTYSVKVPDSNIVLGLDITLNSLSKALLRYSNVAMRYHEEELYLYKENGDLLASNQISLTQHQAPKLSKVPHLQLIELAKNKDNLNQLIPLDVNNTHYCLYIAKVGEYYGHNSYLAIMVSKESLFAKSTERVTTSIMLTGICLILFLPISLVFAKPIIEPIKSLAVEAVKIKERRYDERIKISSNIVEIENLNNAMTEMGESIKAYQLSQKELMDSFIKLIAQAIDEKSPYTAGHCNRVPELGIMLADEAQLSDLPAFKDFKFTNADQQREFHLAAWLHDCGKITTPEYIVDKGTKLETIYNRIHEIRMRFEVLRRDAEIEYYQKLNTSPDKQEVLQKQLLQRQQQLTEDFEFVANANIGGEFFTEQDKDRLINIGKQTWLRHFDDHLGLSPAEKSHINGATAVLPVQENLLADKPEHIIERYQSVDYAPELGIKMDIPEHLYNHGELYNLCISRGTLTKEDRFKINQHVISTISMLETLPFPPELANVPRYASTHHETLKGTGYPRKLTAEQLSIPERILVLADIFEALTAADRPYKEAKTLSVAIDILYKMTLDDHVDPDIFRLFLETGTYLQYANRFLPQAQIDEVNIDQYLNR